MHMEIERYIIAFTQNNVCFLSEVNDVINYININYMKPITLDLLARINCTCKSTLQRKFHDATGRSPMQYLKVLRMNLAAEMLMSSKKSVVEIAIDVGYNSISSFNRHFLNEFYTTPTKWRQQARAENIFSNGKNVSKSSQPQCLQCVVDK